jgi:hypothetical protein
VVVKQDSLWMRRVASGLASMLTGTGKTSLVFWNMVVFHMKMQGWRSPL